MHLILGLSTIGGLSYMQVSLEVEDSAMELDRLRHLIAFYEVDALN